MVVQIPYVIYLLGGVAVRVATNPAGRELVKKLIAQGFKKQPAYKKFKDFTTATGDNIIGLITRAKNAIKGDKPAASGKPPAGTNKLGSSGQSATGRKLGSRRMANFGKVRGGKGRAESMAKAKPTTTGGSKPLTTSKPDPVLKPAPVKANPKPGLSAGSTSRTVVRIRPKPASSSGSKIVSATPTIAGLIAAGAIGKVAYDAYIKENNPTASQIKAADKKIKTIAQGDVYAQRLLEKTKQIDATVLRAKKKTKADALKEKIKTKVKAEAAELDAAKAAALKEKIAAKAREAEIKKRKAAKLDAAEADAIRKNTPERKSIINKAVRFAAVGEGAGLVKIRKDADKKALTEVLNKKIASKNSTAAKEKARAIDGEYKSLASAKKAGSLYYMHKGKGLRAAITAEEIESTAKRIRGEAMKKIGEGK